MLLANKLTLNTNAYVSKIAGNSTCRDQNKGQGPLNGGVSNGGASRSGLVLPFLSSFGTFPIFPGFSRFARGSGPFPKKVGNPPVWKPPGFWKKGKDPHPQDKIQHLDFTKDPWPLYYKTPPVYFTTKMPVVRPFSVLSKDETAP